MMKTEMHLIGNLKQNPETLTKALALTKEYLKLKNINPKIKLGLALPMPFLHEVIKKHGKQIKIFSQSISATNNGSNTGAVSAQQLSSIGVRHSIIGHSERRREGETNELIQKQIENALAKKMYIVLCVGEKERHEDTGHIRYVNEQIETALGYIKKIDLKYITVAYEPVWAIGPNALRNANENEIYEMTIAIRKKLVNMFGKNSGSSVSILYGGSVNAKNCRQILSVHNISGFLLGRASLDPKEVKKIIETIHNHHYANN